MPTAEKSQSVDAGGGGGCDSAAAAGHLSPRAINQGSSPKAGDTREASTKPLLKAKTVASTSPALPRPATLDPGSALSVNTLSGASVGGASDCGGAAGGGATGYGAMSGTRYTKKRTSKTANEFIPGLAARAYSTGSAVGSRAMARNDSRASYTSNAASLGSMDKSDMGGSNRSIKALNTAAVVAEPGSLKDKQNQAHASYRLGFRRSLFEKRKQLSDVALVLAFVGIGLMVLDNEIYTYSYLNSHASQPEWSWACLVVIKSLITLSTILLVASIVFYHAREIQLFMVDNCVDDWQIAMTLERVTQITAEIVVCLIHPPPLPGINRAFPKLQLLLSLLMFSRLYLIGRAMLLHSKLFTDASSRSIGALNRINFNTRFVIKTLMTICPGSVLMVFTVSVWFILSWMMRLCENSGGDGSSGGSKIETFLDSMYLVGITFFAIGYGDYFPETYCGRGVSITCGLMGAGCTAMVVAVLARKLELSRAEKHVHNFMMDNQLSKRLKSAAANVLRETWFIYKNTKLSKKLNQRVIRKHQRLFLSAIHTLRKTKIDQRKLFDQANQMVDMAKTQELISTIYERLQENNQNIETRITLIEQKLDLIHQSLSQVLPGLTPPPAEEGEPGGGATPQANHLPPMNYTPNPTRTRSLIRRPRVVNSRQGSSNSETTA